MSQPRIIEIPYHDFQKILLHATNARKKIEKFDKTAWVDFVQKHKIPEAGMNVKGKRGAMTGNIKAVIIDGDGAADGYYVYSADDLFCIKYELGLE